MATRRTREQWNALTPAYRKRLISAAKSGKLTGTPIQGTPAQVERKAREAYLRGTGLTAARGKHPNRRNERAPKGPTQRAARGEATTRDLRELSRWQRTQAPKWIRDAGTMFSEDTAAILSNVNLVPSNWKEVKVFPGRDANGEPDGTYVVYFVSRKGGRDRKVILPDYTASQELEAYVRILNLGAGEQVAGPGRTPDFVRIGDYQRASDVGSKSTPTNQLPNQRVGKALQPKRKK